MTCSFVANEYSGIVHVDLSECAGKMREDNQVFYEELYHALRDGYEECGLCIGFWGSDDFQEMKEWQTREKRWYFSECLVCGERRGVQKAHIIPRTQGGWDLMPLCPNHHWNYDHWILSFDELGKIVRWLKREHGEDFTKDVFRRYMEGRIKLLNSDSDWDFGMPKRSFE